jgi:hypothetical protein
MVSGVAATRVSPGWISAGTPMRIDVEPSATHEFHRVQLLSPATGRDILYRQLFQMGW